MWYKYMIAANFHGAPCRLRVALSASVWLLDVGLLIVISEWWVVTNFTLKLGNFEVHSLAIKARISSWCRCRCMDKDALKIPVFLFCFFLLICIIGPFRGFIFKTLVIWLTKTTKETRNSSFYIFIAFVLADNVTTRVVTSKDL